MFGEDGFTFLDFLDIINQLQHVPVVSSIYRYVTGDEIDPGARMVGSAIFGGPSGFAMAVVNNAMDAHTGQDIGETVISAVDPDADETLEELPVLAAAGSVEQAAASPRWASQAVRRLRCRHSPSPTQTTGLSRHFPPRVRPRSTRRQYPNSRPDLLPPSSRRRQTANSGDCRTGSRSARRKAAQPAGLEEG